MLVIADRERAVAIAGVMGGAASEVSATHDAHRARKRVVPAGDRCARPAASSGLKTEASARFERGADIDRARCARSRARCALLEEIGAGTARRRRRRRLPARRPSRDASRCARDASRRLLGDAVPDARRRAHPRRGSASGSTPTADGWHVDGAGVPRGRRARGRPHRGGRPALGLRPDSRDVPGAARDAAAGRRPAVARDRRLRRLLCGAGLQEAVTFTFIERAAAAPFARPARRRRSRSRTRCPRSSRCCGRRSCPACSTRSSTTGAARPTTSGCSRSGAVFRADGEAHARRLGADRRARRALERQRRRRRLLRRQGHRRAARRARSASSVDARRRPTTALVRARARCGAARARRTASASIVGRVGQIRASIVAGARPRRTDAVVGGEIDLAALVARAATAPAPRIDAAAALPVDRPRSVDSRRRTLACRRSSWHDSIERAGDARGGARVRSVSRQGRAGRSGEPVDAADVPRRRPHADRRAKCSRPSTPSSPRSAREHGAMLRGK